MQGESSDFSQNNKNKECLRILHYNARSLLPKLYELRATVEADMPVVVCITESWLSEEIGTDELNISNYNILRLDRDHHGGGVLIYVSSHFSVKTVMSGPNDLELIFIFVSCKYFSYCIGLFYRPPSSAIDIFDRLSSALGSLDAFYFSHFVLLGDFIFLLLHFCIGN